MTNVLTCKVAGVKAGGHEETVAAVSVNDPVALVPEPDNAYDPAAVAVWVCPHILLERPDLLVSSFRVIGGQIADVDRAMFRQAGYLPRGTVPAGAIPSDLYVVGYVDDVNTYGPFNTVVGFTVTAQLPARG